MRSIFTVSAAALIVSLLGMTQAQAKDPTGEALISTTEVTATVVQIDHQTRAVTIKAADGEEISFIAGDEVRNLAQVKVGDVITATYIEEIAWEVHRGGQADLTGTVAGGRAAPGEMPAGLVASQVVLTVEIIAIDLETPTVTFRGPQGQTKTILVRHPERLEGVKVGDTVDIIYSEAFAIQVDRGQ
jgi:hypothetical protein